MLSDCMSGVAVCRCFSLWGVHPSPQKRKTLPLQRPSRLQSASRFDPGTGEEGLVCRVQHIWTLNNLNLLPRAAEIQPQGVIGGVPLTVPLRVRLVQVHAIGGLEYAHVLREKALSLWFGTKRSRVQIPAPRRKRAVLRFWQEHCSQIVCTCCTWCARIGQLWTVFARCEIALGQDKRYRGQNFVVKG